MTYQVLARKWRPRTFEELVGQEHVLRALVNALDHDRLHHAFLFTGTRGVGKTTIGRILAKSLNCEEGVSSHPCGKCSACQEIDEGRFIDLIEVDAASRTKVEDTRELLENVQYAPTRGRYKVYLIDEVHMLSNHSFNALLKTLEEPPPHVKFLLATTDPQKLPVTILSRCLQFNLKRLPVRMIADHLQHIMEAERIQADSPAIFAIARAADGSMRDALSLLDQAIAHGGGTVQESEVRDMLGSIEQGHVIQLLRALASGDAKAVLDEVAQTAEHAPDFDTILSELNSLLHRVAVAQMVPDAVDDSLGDQQEVLALAQQVLPEDIQLFYQIGLIGLRDLPLAPDPRTGLEMVLLRMLAFRPVTERPGSDTPPRRKASAPGPKDESVAAKPVRPVPAGKPAPRDSKPPVAQSAGATQWDDIVEALGLKAMARELAVHCVLTHREGATLQLMLDSTYEQLNTQSACQRLEQALTDYYGQAMRVVIKVGKAGQETPAQKREREQHERQESAVESIRSDPFVQELQETFNANLDAAVIEPSD